MPEQAVNLTAPGHDVIGLPAVLPTVETGWAQLLGALVDLTRLAIARPDLIAASQLRLLRRLIGLFGADLPASIMADDRFDHPAWQQRRGFRMTLQAYGALADSLRELVDSAPVPEARRRRLRFAAEHVIAALAPTNLWLTHPGFYQRLRATGGRSALAGARALWQDMGGRAWTPARVDHSAFRVGHNIAATSGAVIFRNEMCELIQYAPRCRRVDARALLLVPSQIHKFYLFDLTAERSLVRHALAAGQQVFALSWRNPSAVQRAWGIGDYAAALDQAIDVVWRVTGEQPVKLAGASAGGLTAAIALARRSREGRAAQVACLSLFVTLLAPSVAATREPDAVARALARSARRGVLDGRDLARSFVWQCPDTLFWQFVTHRYVLGEAPAASDIWYWYEDTTRLPAALHADLLAIYRDSGLARAQGMVLDGMRLHLADIGHPVFFVAGDSDHIAPWPDCYEAARQLGGEHRFVLARGGHLRALVCPPGAGPATAFATTAGPAPDAAAWAEAADWQAGSWWPLWLQWCQEHGGAEVAAPERYGHGEFEPVEAAPGRYVRQR